MNVKNYKGYICKQAVLLEVIVRSRIFLEVLLKTTRKLASGQRPECTSTLRSYPWFVLSLLCSVGTCHCREKLGKNEIPVSVAVNINALENKLVKNSRAGKDTDRRARQGHGQKSVARTRACCKNEQRWDLEMLNFEVQGECP
jgi:hypothetical protein